MAEDRGNDFQAPVYAKASAAAHARVEAVLASQRKANAEARAKDNAAHDKVMGKAPAAPAAHAVAPTHPTPTPTQVHPAPTPTTGA